MVRLKKSIGVVHAIAECLDCGWIALSYKNAQANAARHARSHGHRVSGEVGLAFVYDGRGRDSIRPRGNAPREDR